MSELFEAIGFEIPDEESYNLLAEYAETSGERTQIHRVDATLHGRCWKVGDGVEVWSLLYERGSDFYYADCRPAFRSRYVRTIQPWELIEYDEEGEAIVRGRIQNGADVVFELQNLTEVDSSAFRETHLRVALAGLVYSARLKTPTNPTMSPQPCFRPADQATDFEGRPCENDYLISGRVLGWREISNNITGSGLVWIYLDALTTRLEVLASRRAISGGLAIGSFITARIWLQGHVLQQYEITARYEGVDQEFETSDFWSSLRRGN